jgi:hypothetical protein
MSREIKVGDLVFSQYFGKEIRVVKITSDTDWEFEIDGVVEKAHTPLSFFEARLDGMS